MSHRFRAYKLQGKEGVIMYRVGDFKEKIGRLHHMMKRRGDLKEKIELLQHKLKGYVNNIASKSIWLSQIIH